MPLSHPRQPRRVGADTARRASSRLRYPPIVRESEEPLNGRVVNRGVIVGRQIHALPGRGWIGLPLLFLVHLPLAAINWLTRGRLDRAAVAVLRFEVRIACGWRFPHPHSG